MTSAAPDAVAALDGVRVLDLADESAAFAGRVLADLGADVVMVEPLGGARTRQLAPFFDEAPEAERSLVHQYHGANKRSLRLDATQPEGATLLKRLVERSDVLIETATPGSLDALGLSHEALRARNPHLIHASVTPFGLEGEWRDWRANDLVAGAAGGLVWLCGEPGDTPLQGAANPSYSMGSLAAATGILLALTARERDPERAGAHLDISLQEATSMACMQTANPSWWAWHEIIPRRPGLSGALECKDGEWLGLMIRPDRFDRFLEWTAEAGVETELTAADWHHARVGAPRRNNPVSAATLELSRVHTRDAFVARAQQAEMVCLPILDFPSMDAHEQFLANQQFLEVDHERLGRPLGFVRSPVDALAREIPLRRAPLLGEHDAELLAELALDGPERARLAELGVIAA